MRDANRKILIVDDTAMFRELGALFLARSGRVITASGAAEGLAMAKSERPDIVVADLNMPGMDGDVLCKLMKSDPGLRKIPIIVATSSDHPSDRARAVQAGADDIIAKPISRVSLIDAVNRFLRSASPRGLKRVWLDADVHIYREREGMLGHATNLSRGGIFVESDKPMPPETEVQLEFQLPEDQGPLTPTARVIWSRRPARGRGFGMGLQFLALDRASTHRIEEFVYENAEVQTLKAAPRRASAGS